MRLGQTKEVPLAERPASMQDALLFEGMGAWYIFRVAIIERSSGELVIRVAYDGAAMAGKTTNIQRLSDSLKQEVYTPGQRGERTVFFDWMKYKGGRFEGRPIRCEMVTVPGQALLRERRELLLREADVVVKVFDASQTNPQEIKASVELLQQAAGFEVPRGVLVQLNKTDLADSQAVDAIAKSCSEFEEPIQCIKAVACEGQGVQETFVYAVRTALKRVQQLRARGLLPEAEDMSGERLLAWLNKNEALMHGADPGVDPTKGPGSQQVKQGPSLPSQQSLAEPLSVNSTFDGRAPAIPSASVPQGRIWPPTMGRAMMDQIDYGGCGVEAVEEGAWYCSDGQNWHMYSAASAVFPSEEIGINALLVWARYCASLGEHLSQPRCIVLAPEAQESGDDGRTSWRIWQIVRAKPSIRDEIASQMDQSDPEAAALRIAQGADGLIQMESKRPYFPNLPQCSLDNVGSDRPPLQIVGFLPPAPLPNHPAPSTTAMDSYELLLREFSGILATDWAGSAELRGALEKLARTATDVGIRQSARQLAKILGAQLRKARGRKSS